METFIHDRPKAPAMRPTLIASTEQVMAACRFTTAIVPWPIDAQTTLEELLPHVTARVAIFGCPWPLADAVLEQIRETLLRGEVVAVLADTARGRDWMRQHILDQLELEGDLA
jgi:hypothetical protein